MIVCLHKLFFLKAFEGLHVDCNYVMSYSRKMDIYGETILTMLAIINIA